MSMTADVVVCGAGIAGVSAAYHLAVRHRLDKVLLVDQNPPLSLTSNNSNECYRNWWPGPGNAMVALMNRSLDILEELAEETNNVFQMNRRGYLYCTSNPDRIPEMTQEAIEISRLGGGALRIHDGKNNTPPYQPSPEHGYASAPGGADLITDPHLIRTHFPYLSDNVVAALHVRRAGWLSAQQLGMYALEQARLYGVKYIHNRVENIQLAGGRFSGVTLEDGTRISANHLVIAAGPYLKQVGSLIGLDLPVYNELHLKTAILDNLGVIDRKAPLIIFMDSQTLDWNPEERESLSEDVASHWLLELFPAGVHSRPEGGQGSQVILLLWEYQTKEAQPVFPVPLDYSYPEIALRGMASLVPGLKKYYGKFSRPKIDGGYYTRTVENRPLIGPLPVDGAFVIGALSGFGIMSSMAAGELLAAHLTGSQLPPYASAFSLSRYEHPEYRKLLAEWGASGQL